jgi:carbon monoxide dehydrogenase subunit G
LINLYHRKNEIAIDLTGVQNVAGIEIYYNGKMYAESQLPDDWILSSNASKIVCFSLGDSVPELLLNYSGLINIKGGKVFDKNLAEYSINVLIEDVDKWTNFNIDFDKNTQYWEGLNSTHIAEHSIKHSSIVKNNLKTNNEEFYFLDGQPYNGDYHLHGDGRAMTGAEHTNESIQIYRKNEDGKIVDLRSKASKKRAIEIMKQIKPFIPSVRKVTKSSQTQAKDFKKQIAFSKKEFKVPAVNVKAPAQTTAKVAPAKITTESKIEKY